jgi:hypothetical protein
MWFINEVRQPITAQTEHKVKYSYDLWIWGRSLFKNRMEIIGNLLY